MHRLVPIAIQSPENNAANTLQGSQDDICLRVTHGYEQYVRTVLAIDLVLVLLLLLPCILYPFYSNRDHNIFLL